MFEIGCDLFERNPKGGNFHLLDKWWLIDSTDFLKDTEDPVVVKSYIEKV